MIVKKRFNLFQLITAGLVLVILLQMTSQQLIYSSNGEISKNNQVSFRHPIYLVETMVNETFAETNVTHVFDNPTDSSELATFIVTLPTGGYLSNASLTTKGQTFWGTILEVREAEQAFENATKAGRSAVIINQMSNNNYEVSVNVANLSKATVSVYYIERLLRVLGNYNLRTIFDNSQSDAESFTHEIQIFTPKRFIENIFAPNGYLINYLSSTYAVVSYYSNVVPNSDNSIKFSLSGENLGTNVFSYTNGTNDFFVATFSPELETLNASQLGKDFIFVIDVSGSMAGSSGTSTKMDQAKTALNRIIDDLYFEDRFGIVKFSSNAESALLTLVDRSDSSAVANMKQWVTGLSAGGGTDIYGGLTNGLDLFESNSRPKIMVLLTDGDPTSGVTNTETIIDLFTNDNQELGTSLFSLGFGDDLKFEFLQSLSRSNNGDALKISTSSDATEQITGFYELIESPILIDLTITSKSGIEGDLYPYFLPNLYQGSEIFLVGKKNGEIKIEINGTSSNAEETWLIIDASESSNSSSYQWVEQLYALAVIDDLLIQINYLSEDTSSLKKQVLDLALYYGIVTPYTSLFIDTKDLESHPETPEEGLIPGDSPQTTYIGTQTQYGAPTTTTSETMAASASFNTISVLIGLGFVTILFSRKKINK
ncbi:MAG: hypothetical protein HeimC3_13560 [Candidatus Heimdallarchaeota archaeon LC_3]|nr:MAG: hypothetical protein HeimC3_13560 [Candidatus Heimdallarchaeota archaeon LC_3]